MKADLFPFQDPLAFLDQKLPLNEKLVKLHQHIQSSLPEIARIAVALYDPETDLIKTFIYSTGGDPNPLTYYDAPLKESCSLCQIRETGQPRVINDLSVFENGTHYHTQRIQEQGYLSSYTQALMDNNQFAGFLFFNSYQKDAFTPPKLAQINVYAHLISMMVNLELAAFHSLQVALRTAIRMIHEKDPETGKHLERMARYSRLIAKELARSGKYSYNDEFIETIFLWSPVHDVGKISIPDHILLKPGNLDEAEWAIMQTHVSSSIRILEDILQQFDYTPGAFSEMPFNIASYHHEHLDGSGYPFGLTGDRLPLESRITAVADVFDALTSRRPYKEIWSLDSAFEEILSLAGIQLDEDCVAALVKNRAQVQTIYSEFLDE